MAVARYRTPFGPLEAVAGDGRLRRVQFCWDRPDATAQGSDPALERLGELLTAYCDGEPVSFDIPLEWSVVRGLRADVLRRTAEIPYGETSTYGRLATLAGRPTQARAAGGALRSNPWVLVVPCHRVVAASGALSGYGGGPQRGGRLDVKAALLAHERAGVQPSLFDSPAVGLRT